MVQDGLGNAITFSYYDEAGAPRPSGPDPDHFEDLIWKVTDHAGRSVEYLYEHEFVEFPSPPYYSLVRELVGVKLPSVETVAGTFDLPTVHERFPGGRTIEYAYHDNSAGSSMLGLLVSKTDTNGVGIIENHYLRPIPYDINDIGRLIYKQDYAEDSYTYMYTDLDGDADSWTPVNDFFVWVQKRDGSVVRFEYTAYTGNPGSYNLVSRANYPGKVPSAARGKCVWYDESTSAPSWYYADDPESTPTPFTGLTAPVRSGDTDIVIRKFDFNDDWHQTRLEKPSGDVIEYVYDESAGSQQQRGALLEIISKPAGTILDNDGLPLSSHADWITQSFEYDGPGAYSLPGCGCGSTGSFPTSETDGNGNRTEFTYDSRGNLTNIYHDIPAGMSGTANASAHDEFEYDTTTGSMVSHTHPETIRLVGGVETTYRRKDTFEYYSDTYTGNIGSRGKLWKIHIDVGDGTNPGENLTTVFEYDAIGNISKVIESDGDITELLHNQANQLVRKRHLDGVDDKMLAQTDYYYDANGNLVMEEIADFEGKVEVSATFDTVRTIYEYDARDLLTMKSTERVSSSYDPFATQDSIAKSFSAPIGPDWVTDAWVYDEDGKITAAYRGVQSISPIVALESESISYDFRDLPYEIVRGAGSANELVTRFNYDANRRMVDRIINPNGGPDSQYLTLSYDGHDRVVSALDPMNNEITIGYDKNSNMTSVSVCGSISDDTTSAETQMVFLEEYEYDARDRLKKQRGYIFDELVAAATACNVVPGTFDVQDIEYEYNQDSSLKQMARPSGQSADHVTSYYYDTVGRTEFVQDLSGQVQFAYDSGSNLSAVINRDYSTTSAPTLTFARTFEYDALDRREEFQDGRSNTTSYLYDSRSNLIGVLDPRANFESMDYDGLNRLVERARTMTLDGDGPLGDTVDPTNGEIVETMGYDDASRLISEADDNSNTTEYQYDEVGRRTKIIMPDLEEYAFEYNASGQPFRITDARGVQTTQTHDLNNRLTRRDINPMGNTIGGALREDFTYDSLGRVQHAQTWSDVLGTQPLTSVTRDYDSRGRVLEEVQHLAEDGIFVSGHERTVTYAHDLADNLVGMVYPHGRTIHREYDEVNRLIGIYNDAAMVDPIRTMEYIGVRPERYTDGVAGLSTTVRTVFKYAGYNGAVVQLGDHGFEKPERILTTNPHPTTTVLDDHWFKWDESQNRTAYEQHLGTLPDRRERSFGYDSANRLVTSDVVFPDSLSSKSDNTTTYSLDGVHNRLEVTSSLSSGTPGELDAGAPLGEYELVDTDHQSNNQYTHSPRAEADKWIYTYDANGNMIRKFQDSPANVNGDNSVDFFDVTQFMQWHQAEDPRGDFDGNGEFEYFDIQAFLAAADESGEHLEFRDLVYDAWNRLVGVQDGFGTVATTQAYVYDAFGRRLGEYAEIDDGEAVIEADFQYVYGANALWEVIERIQLAIGEDPELLLTSHVLSDRIDDEVGYRIENLQVPENYWSHRDDLGSLLSVSNANGDVVERFEYGDYGQVRYMSETGVRHHVSSHDAHHLYTGRPLLAHTGIMEYRYRVHSYDMGRFLQRDPYGYLDSMNIYVYSSSTPHVKRDPMGLFPLAPGDLDSAVIGITNRLATQVVNTVKGIHYNRNSSQPTRTAEEVTASRSGWTQLPPEQSVFHGLSNKKYVKGKEEVVINPLGQVVTDQTDGGTYNYANPQTLYGVPHFILDVVPYYIWGNGPCDKNGPYKRYELTKISIKIVILKNL